MVKLRIPGSACHRKPGKADDVFAVGETFSGCSQPGNSSLHPKTPDAVKLPSQLQCYSEVQTGVYGAKSAWYQDMHQNHVVGIWRYAVTHAVCTGLCDSQQEQIYTNLCDLHWLRFTPSVTSKQTNSSCRDLACLYEGQ